MNIRDHLYRARDLSEEYGVVPKSGYHLSELLKCDMNEGVEMALFPEKVENGRLGEPFVLEYVQEKLRAWPVFTTNEAWGERLLDIQAENFQDIKWWKVRMHAKEKGLNLPPTAYSGPVVGIPLKYFHSDVIMGLRFYAGGPWFWPMEVKSFYEETVAGRNKTAK